MTIVRWALVVLCLLTLPAPVYAECAWVLWNAHWDNETKEYQYRFVRTFPTRPECDDNAAFRTRNMEEARKRYPDVRGPALWGVLHCVPDTIDPRGPKGTGR